MLRTSVPEVLAIRYDWRDTSLVTLHNFSSTKQTVKVRIDGVVHFLCDEHALGRDRVIAALERAFGSRTLF